MPKQKRTRRQKMQTDKRRLTTHSSEASASQQSVTFSLPQSYSAPSPIAPTTSATLSHARIETGEYTYLRRDLSKTLALTSAIVIIEIFVRYFLERG